MTYQVLRTTPAGHDLAHTGLKSKRQAATAVAYCLTDNNAASKQQAAAIAFQVENSPLGTTVPAFGYTFRVVQEVDATA